MGGFRLALANLRAADTPAESVRNAARAIADAGALGARLVCFPECYVPGYRWPGTSAPPPDQAFLDAAWATLACSAAEARLAVVLGTERVVDDGLRISALVIAADGTCVGFQDKVQLDPSEEAAYAPGHGRRIFTCGPLTFGVVICHEGWRYPETTRWAARRGAQVVFHPHAHVPEPGAHRPSTFGDPANTYHEKAMLCRAAENACYFASVNYAAEGSATTSAIVGPDGNVVCWQPYGQEGLLVADLDLASATRLYARRLRPDR